MPLRALRGACFALSVSVAPAHAMFGVSLGPGDIDQLAGSTGPGVHARIRYASFTDWTRPQDFSGNWSGRYSPRDGSNFSFISLRTEAGLQYGPWRVARIERRESLVRVSRGMLDFLYLERNRLPAEVGRTYEADIRASGFEATGYRLEGARKLSVLQDGELILRAGVESLAPGRWRESQLHGRISALPGDTFSYNAAWSDSDARKTYPFLTPGTPSGSGYSTDFEAVASWGETHRLRLEVRDAFSRIRLRAIPSTDATARSDTATRDADGFLIYQPAVVGQNRRKDLVLRLEPKTTLQYERAYRHATLGIGAFAVDGTLFPFVAAARGVFGFTLTASYDARTRAAGLSVGSRAVSLGVKSDRVLGGAGKSLVLEAAASLTF